MQRKKRRGEPFTDEERAITKAAYLEAYALYGVQAPACDAAGVSHESIRHWKDADPEFATAITQAHEEATQLWEAEMRRRAIDGTDKPVYQNGKKVGMVKEYSDTLLIFGLKAKRPEVYRDNKSITLNGTVTFEQMVSEIVNARES